MDESYGLFCTQPHDYFRVGNGGEALAFVDEVEGEGEVAVGGVIVGGAGGVAFIGYFFIHDRGFLR